jgi:hypothetical protein
MHKLKIKINITLALCSILVIWFLFGLVPALWDSGSFDSGKLGDSFGGVNALFAGLGFVGLIYTLLLQIENSEKDNNLRKFEFLYNLINEIKSDYENLQLGNLSGPTATHTMKRNVEADKRYAEQYHIQFKYLITCSVLFYDLLFLLKKYESNIESDELNVLKMKVLLVSFNYTQVFEDLPNASPENENSNIFNDHQELVRKIAITLDEPFFKSAIEYKIKA